MKLPGEAKGLLASATLLLLTAGCMESAPPQQTAPSLEAAADASVSCGYDPSFPETPGPTDSPAAQELLASAPVSAPPVEEKLQPTGDERVAPTDDPLVLAGDSQAVAAPDVLASADSTTTSNAPTTSTDTEFVPPPELPRKTSGLYDITFDHLKFNIEKDGEFQNELLTEQIEQLEGEKVRIRGYIYPTLRQSGITNFVLVRDNMECCFGPGAALFDCIVVAMNSGAGIEYTVRPVAVEGTFKLNEVKDFDGKTRAIFHLDGQKVK